MSIFRIPDPTNNCKIIEAVTIGPIPKLMTLPKSVPRINARYSKRSREFFAKPYRGILARTKKAARIIKVHLSLTLKLNFFSVGYRTSGKLYRKL